MNDEIKRLNRKGYRSRQRVILRASLCGLALWGAAACSASDHSTTDPPTTPGADADLPDLPRLALAGSSERANRAHQQNAPSGWRQTRICHDQAAVVPNLAGGLREERYGHRDGCL